MSISSTQINFVASLLNESDPNLINESASKLETDSIRHKNVPLRDELSLDDPRQVLADINFVFDYYVDIAGSPRTYNNPGEGFSIEVVDVEPEILSARVGDRTINCNNIPKFIEAAKSYFMNMLVSKAEEHILDRQYGY